MMLMRVLTDYRASSAEAIKVVEQERREVNSIGNRKEKNVRLLAGASCHARGLSSGVGGATTSESSCRNRRECTPASMRIHDANG